MMSQKDQKVAIATIREKLQKNITQAFNIFHFGCWVIIILINKGINLVQQTGVSLIHKYTEIGST